jgi:hypothetical protein
VDHFSLSSVYVKFAEIVNHKIDISRAAAHRRKQFPTNVYRQIYFLEFPNKYVQVIAAHISNDVRRQDAFQFCRITNCAYEFVIGREQVRA